MAISSGGTNTITIKATFDKKLFSPSLYYRAKLLKEDATTGAISTEETCYATIGERTDLGYEGYVAKNRSAGYTSCGVDEVTSPGNVIVSFTGLDENLTGTFRVKLEACMETASGGENCGGFGSDGLQTHTLP